LIYGVGFEPVQIPAIHDDERLILAGECRFQTCGIVEVADDEFDLGAELRRLRAVAHQGAERGVRFCRIISVPTVPVAPVTRMSSWVIRASPFVGLVAGIQT
jgi:hypothetical protein